MAREIGLRSFMKEGGSDKIILEFSTILGGNMFTGVAEVNIGRAWRVRVSSGGLAWRNRES